MLPGQKLIIYKLKLADSEEVLKKKEAEEKSLYQELSEIERSLSKAKAQFEVIEQAELTLTGLAEGAKNLIQAAKNGKLRGSLKTIGGLLDVPANLEMAIGSVLGDQLDGIVLGEDANADDVLTYLEGDSGRAVLYPQAWIKSAEKIKNIQDPELIGIASDLIQSTDLNKTLIALLLGQVVVVKTRAAAKRLMNSIPKRAGSLHLQEKYLQVQELSLPAKINGHHWWDDHVRKKNLKFPSIPYPIKEMKSMRNLLHCM